MAISTNCAPIGLNNPQLCDSSLREESFNDNFQCDETPSVNLLNDATLNSTISIVSWNIRGIGDKLHDTDLQKYLFENEIIILFETMCNNVTSLVHVTNLLSVLTTFILPVGVAPTKLQGIGRCCPWCQIWEL